MCEWVVGHIDLHIENAHSPHKHGSITLLHTCMSIMNAEINEYRSVHACVCGWVGVLCACM